MSELDLTKPAAGGSGGTTAKTVTTPTGALTGGVSKIVAFAGGATFPNGRYSLTAYNRANNEIVYVELKAGQNGDTTTRPTHFTVFAAVDMPLGLDVVAVGS